MSKSPKSPYFINKTPKMPSLKEINQSKAKDVCCSDCVSFWDRVQALEPYFLEEAKQKQLEEKEFDTLQKKLSKEHQDDPITIRDRTKTKCRCGHNYLAHNETGHGWRNTHHSSCNTCGCDNFVDHILNRKTRKKPVYQLQNKIRKGILALFNDPNYCLSDPEYSSNSTNQHQFSAKYYPSGRKVKVPQYCIHCRRYLADLRHEIGLGYNKKRGRSFQYYPSEYNFFSHEIRDEMKTDWEHFS